uniref:Uncharacterized protein n=1 Tax=Fagus sylvatica TaxID=28930 RepID=A0A2N9EGN7_FAGSY
MGLFSGFAVDVRVEVAFVLVVVRYVLGWKICLICRSGSWFYRFWWVSVGCEVSHGGFLWGVLARCGLRGVSWWVCGVAHGCGRWCLVDLVAVTGYL